MYRKEATITIALSSRSTRERWDVINESSGSKIDFSLFTS